MGPRLWGHEGIEEGFGFVFSLLCAYVLFYFLKWENPEHACPLVLAVFVSACLCCTRVVFSLPCHVGSCCPPSPSGTGPRLLLLLSPRRVARHLSIGSSCSQQETCSAVRVLAWRMAAASFSSRKWTESGLHRPCSGNFS